MVSSLDNSDLLGLALFDVTGGLGDSLFSSGVSAFGNPKESALLVKHPLGLILGLDSLGKSNLVDGLDDMVHGSGLSSHSKHFVNCSTSASTRSGISIDAISLLSEPLLVKISTLQTFTETGFMGGLL